MPCCGDKRAELTQIPTSAQKAGPVYYQYTGRTGLLVIGRETRSRYRFDRPGAVVAVDARDQSAMEHVPNLRRVPG